MTVTWTESRYAVQVRLPGRAQSAQSDENHLRGVI
jgi:hypothetical protein